MSGYVCHITGARPNFPKAAPVVAALSGLGIEQRLIHTGQHYDDKLSDVFFRDLGLPLPDVNLNVGSGSHAQQTATIMTRFEEQIAGNRPEIVVVYGDVNSTVATALVAAKMTIPVAHVEAGLRSFDMAMPEEVNRIVTDRLSDLLFATTPDAIANLAGEGVERNRIHFVGNPMIDTLMKHLPATDPAVIRRSVELPRTYAVATLHRPSNVDSSDALTTLTKALHQVAEMIPLVLPVHPRGRAGMRAAGLFDHPSISHLDPLGYIDFLSLVRGADLVITDSGGVQEETTMLGIPCLTMRLNTERPVTITHGTNRLTTTDDLAEVVNDELVMMRIRTRQTPPLWDGHSGERIAAVLDTYVRTPL